MEVIYEIQKYLIVFVGLTFFYIEIALFFKYRKIPKKILYTIVGLYWAIYYIYSIIRPIIGSSYIAHQEFVRPGILFTLSVFLAQALNKWRYLKND